MKNKFIALIILAAALTACTEKMDIDLNTTYKRLVVEGQITSDKALQHIKLTHSSDYYYEGQPPAVENAEVSVNDGIKDIIFRESSPGMYVSTEEIRGDTLKNYELNIKLNEPIGGKSEYSASSSLPPIDDNGYIEIEYHDDWLEGIWEVKLYAKDPPDRNFYLFRSMQNGVMVTDTITEWIISDDEFFNGNYTKGIGVAYFNREEGQVLKKGDTVTLIMSGITEEYYDFISEVQEQAFGQNPLFSGPPANVNGNINNGGIGFFAAYSNAYFTTVYQGE